MRSQAHAIRATEITGKIFFRKEAGHRENMRMKSDPDTRYLILDIGYLILVTATEYFQLL